jgi:hypothetical protein
VRGERDEASGQRDVSWIPIPVEQEGWFRLLSAPINDKDRFMTSLALLPTYLLTMLWLLAVAVVAVIAAVA